MPIITVLNNSEIISPKTGADIGVWLVVILMVILFLNNERNKGKALHLNLR
jgi:hypothetical protein